MSLEDVRAKIKLIENRYQKHLNDSTYHKGQSYADIQTLLLCVDFLIWKMEEMEREQYPPKRRMP